MVLLQVLDSQASVSGRQEIQKGRVAVLMNAVRGEGSLVGAQALPDDPALHSRVKAILEEHLERRMERQQQGG